MINILKELEMKKGKGFATMREGNCQYFILNF